MNAKRNAVYDELDGAIIRSLASRPTTFTGLQTDVVWTECERLAETANRKKGRNVSVYRITEATRILDRRLQALRRAGTIRYRRGPNPMWELAS